MTPDAIAEIEKELAGVAPARDTLLTVGVFDGVHLGHRSLIDQLKKKARERNLLSGVVTFRLHPRLVVRPSTKLQCLTDLDDRIGKLRSLGPDFVLALPFTRKTASIGARDFVQLLRKYLRMRGLVVGPDFALGKGREGTPSFLEAMGKDLNFTVEVISPVYGDGEVVSSTFLRQALAHGDVRKVARMLGHPHYVRGKVVHGTQHGRDMGFPTANQDVSPGQALPANGVYVTSTDVNGMVFPSVTNIGTRPTFGDNPRSVETYIIGYSGDLYGKNIRVDFLERLRGEVRFAHVEQLKEQIARDIRLATEIHGKLREPSRIA